MPRGHLAAGREGEAVDGARQIRTLWLATSDVYYGAQFLEPLIDALCARAEAAEARGVMDELRRRLRWPPPAIRSVVEPWVGSLSARVASTEGYIDEAIALESDAGEAWRRLGTPYPAARSQLRLARVLLSRARREDRPEAKRLLAEAQGTFEVLGAAEATEALHMRDLYGFGVGGFDISGPTCGADDATFFGTSAWQKTHWGWITPTVVAQDGYYSVDRADSNPEAFILYDPSKGTNDYFVVENRQSVAGTYDQAASDSGLVIWRVDDSLYLSAVDTMRPIEIMRPDGTTTGGCDASGNCYTGTIFDAWNPTSLSTPQRTMSRTWRDGTASNVAVRAIGRSGDAIRAYFDVRGPGILIDPTTSVSGALVGTLQVDVTPGEANVVTFPVMNTSEAADDFEFTITGLPAGWSVVAETKTALGAGAGATANIQVTPAANAAVAVFTATAVGRSKTNAAIVTTAEIKLKVVLHPTLITYTGSDGEPWGTPAGFSAVLTDRIDGSDIVSGATVTFSLWRDSLDEFGPLLLLERTGVSDATGLAVGIGGLPVQPGNHTLIITSERRGKHAAATTSVPYTIEKRPTTMVYSGDATEDYSDPTDVSATLTDTINPFAPVTGDFLIGTPFILLAVGTQSENVHADVSGHVAAVVVVNQPSGIVNASATFAGNGLFLASSDTEPFTITKETLTFTYTGDTLVGLGTTPILSSTAVQESDGWLAGWPGPGAGDLPAGSDSNARHAQLPGRGHEPRRVIDTGNRPASGYLDSHSECAGVKCVLGRKFRRVHGTRPIRP